MFKIFKNIGVMLGVVLIVTGCSNQIQVGEKDVELTNTEKLQRILEVQKDEDLAKKQTVELYGFEIPIYLMDVESNYGLETKDEAYPYVDWKEDWPFISLPLNVKYPENADIYKLENFLSLKYNSEMVQNIIEEIEENESGSIDFEDGTYIMFGIATDDTLIIHIGNIEDKPQ